jgi:hypothetical protein
VSGTTVVVGADVSGGAAVVAIELGGTVANVDVTWEAGGS